MVAFLMGLLGGYTKNFCFLCLVDSTDDANHYKRKYPSRTEYVISKKNIKMDTFS